MNVGRSSFRLLVLKSEALFFLVRALRLTFLNANQQKRAGDQLIARRVPVPMGMIQL